MEKKRRARINQSLNDLKRLLLETDTVKKEVCAFTLYKHTFYYTLSLSSKQFLQWSCLITVYRSFN